MISLGRRIRQAREKAGFTQEQLAEKIDVSRAAVARWELGEIEPKLKNFAALSVVLGVSTDYLLDIPVTVKKESPVISEEAAKALKRFIEEIRK